MENQELTTLISKARAGDAAAMEELLRLAHTPVSYQCRKMLKDPRDAEDMTQEVLLTLYTRLELLKEPAAFWGWLNSITVNRCVNAIKRTHVEFQFAEDEEGHTVLDSLEELDEQQVPDKALDNAETTRMIEEIVNGLSDSQRICTLMFYYDEMSVKEIAQVLEVPENTVKSRLNYARKAIKERVLDYEKQGIKLYGLSPLPFLLYFLRRGAVETASEAEAAAMAGKVLSAMGVETAASAGAGATEAAAESAGAAASAGGAASQAAGGISVKLIAGIAAAVLLAGGAVGGIIAFQHRAPETPEVVLPEEPAAVYLSDEYTDQLPYTGDECLITPDQARAFAEVIQRYSDESAAVSSSFSRFCRAALFDAGDGIPALLISSGDDMGYGDDSGYMPSLTAVYQWDGTQAVRFHEDNASDYVVTEDGLLIDVFNTDDVEYSSSLLYPLSGGLIGPEPAHVYEQFGLLQSGMPSEDALRTCVEAKGTSSVTYDYSTLSGDLWTTEELWQPLWTVASLDGTFLSPNTDSAVSTYATVNWLLGHGQAGIMDASHVWEGEWMDALPTAQILNEGADAADAEAAADDANEADTQTTGNETDPAEATVSGDGPAVDLPGAAYDFTVSYDSAAQIQRVTVDPMGYNAEIFIEIPVFPETTEGYRKINAFFLDKRNRFLMDTTGDISTLLYNASNTSELLSDTQEASIQYPMDGAVNVEYTVCWDSGGQLFYANENYLFRTDTGDLLTLADLVDGTEEQIKAGILADVRNSITDVPALQSWALEDFDFYIQNGQIWITFDRMGLPGIAGAPDVPLSAPLKPLV